MKMKLYNGINSNEYYLLEYGSILIRIPNVNKIYRN